MLLLKPLVHTHSCRAVSMVSYWQNTQYYTGITSAQQFYLDHGCSKCLNMIGQQQVF